MKMNSKSNVLLGWTSFIVSFVALFVSFLALSSVNSQKVNGSSIYLSNSPTPVLTSISDAKLTAQQELSDIKSLINTDIDRDVLLQSINRVRINLAEAYGNASVEIQTELIEIDSKFEQLNDEISTRSDNALLTLENIIANLSQN